MAGDLQSSQEVREIIRICDKTIAQDQLECEEMAAWSMEEDPLPVWERYAEFK